jgi:hypothetical protein
MRWSKLVKAMTLSLALAVTAAVMPQFGTPAQAGAVKRTAPPAHRAGGAASLVRTWYAGKSGYRRPGAFAGFL